MSNKVKIKHSKKDNTFDVSFKGLTLGQASALYNALKYHQTPVGQDVHAFMKNVLTSSDEAEVRHIMS